MRSTSSGGNSEYRPVASCINWRRSCCVSRFSAAASTLLRVMGLSRIASASRSLYRYFGRPGPRVASGKAIIFLSASSSLRACLTAEADVSVISDRDSRISPSASALLDCLRIDCMEPFKLSAMEPHAPQGSLHALNSRAFLRIQSGPRRVIRYSAWPLNHSRCLPYDFYRSFGHTHHERMFHGFSTSDEEACTHSQP